MYLWHTGHNQYQSGNESGKVVDCFQNVSLTYRTQPRRLTSPRWRRCGLLSECIFDIPDTTQALPGIKAGTLWIAFRMYLWHTGHNLSSASWSRNPVVDCFQNVSLTYRTQRDTWCRTAARCCGLLSECIFDIPDTTPNICIYFLFLLWIAFRMYLWHTGHNNGSFDNWSRIVVDCFQNVSLTYRTQLKKQCDFIAYGCGLLSECIFDIPDTTLLMVQPLMQQLWIAFRMYLWHTGHNDPPYNVDYGTGCGLLSECIFDIPDTTNISMQP